MVGNLIRDQFLKARDWPFGATLALCMVVFLVALFALQSVVSRRYAVEGGMPSASARIRLGWLWVPLVLCCALPLHPDRRAGGDVVQQRQVGAELLGTARFRWYPELVPATATSGRRCCNSLLVAVGCHGRLHRARHDAGGRPGPPHPLHRPRRARDGAGDPARPDAGDRAAVLLRRGRGCRSVSTTVLLGPRRVRHGVRRRRRARPARAAGPVAGGGLPGPRRRLVHDLHADHPAVDRARRRGGRAARASRCRSTSS